MPTDVNPTAHLSQSWTNLGVAALLALFALLLFTSARQQSPTFDEPVHLFAGLEYWRHADFGRNPEHPPLAKLLAAAPLLRLDLADPPPSHIPFFKAQDNTDAIHMLYAHNADALLQRGRLVILLISLALAVLVYLAAREMFNPLTGLMALGLFVFEPVLLANGTLITTDMPLACLFFASVYTFYRYIRRPSPARLALCAVASALTVATKHSGILLLPILALLAFADGLLIQRVSPPVHPPATPKRACRRLLVALAVIGIVTYLFLWAFYGFRYAARPGQLAMVPTLSIYASGLEHPWQHALISFFARYHLLPEAYLYGWVDILLIPGTRLTYIFGHLFASGQWFFFPAVFLIKSTLALLVLLALVPFTRVRRCRRKLLFLILPAAFFLLLAIVSQLNMGVRHLLPLYPLCIILAAAAAVSLAAHSLAGRLAVAALLLLTVVSSLHAFPDYLAYSNELAGGPARTYRLVTDSNDDWGQGLKWTRTYLSQHPPAGGCWFDYSNPMLDPADYGIACKPLLSGFGHMVGIPSPPVPSTINGTILVSTTELSGLLWGPGSLNPYQSFLQRRPDASIGNIILVYHGSFAVPLLAAETNAASAILLLRQHRLPEALTLAQTAVSQAPQSADVNATYGQVLLACGRIPEGQQALATALHLAQTSHPEFQKTLIATLQHPPSPHASR